MFNSKKALILLIFLLFGAALWITFPECNLEFLKENMKLIQRAKTEYPVLFLILFLLIYICVTATSIPLASLLSLLAGALFNPLLATLSVCAAATIGATLSFLASRYFFKAWIDRRFAQVKGTISQEFQKHGWKYLLSLRLMPIFPFFLINLIMGMTPIKTKTYMLVSFIGMIPGTFIYINAGQQIAQVNKLEDVLSPPLLFSLFLLGALPLAGRLKLMRFFNDH
ncbi:MAG: VTT domain-containing protein [Bdellovibrionales bacterium]|nr:VTT domain-containing protein [Bdellovibrionales bacterium]